MPVRADWRRLAPLGALLALFSAAAVAHPMPNTEIAISIGTGSAAFDIAIPEPELRLALPRDWGQSADLLTEPRRSELLRYFDAHVSVRTSAGAIVPHAVRSITQWQAEDPDVGQYTELRVRIVAPATRGFDPRRFSLHYDAVIHQVPNHFALVYLSRDFPAGRITEDKPVAIGVIRYDFRHASIPPLEVSLEDASAWHGLLAAVALGFRHVSSGLDHLLFLLCLLIVSPLRAIARRWSLFQGWQYTARRFLYISLAFTAGHSLSLLFGAVAELPLPRNAVEIGVALSVLLAAMHAIRPLFAGSEWKIAAGFGLLHGLAFSETLAPGVLDPLTQASIVLGFNLGVEGAQLIAMACAVPLLYASRWRAFHGLRITAMVVVIGLAAVWIAQRAGGV